MKEAEGESSISQNLGRVRVSIRGSAPDPSPKLTPHRQGQELPRPRGNVLSAHPSPEIRTLLIGDGTAGARGTGPGFLLHHTALNEERRSSLIEFLSSLLVRL